MLAMTTEPNLDRLWALLRVALLRLAHDVSAGAPATYGDLKAEGVDPPATAEEIYRTFEALAEITGHAIPETWRSEWERRIAASRGPSVYDRFYDLRAILKPLLDDPHCNGNPFDGCAACKFCDQYGDHRADCPVLRRDELLRSIT